MMVRIACVVAMCCVAQAAAPQAGQSARALLDGASAELRAGRIANAVATFDRLVGLDPAVEPYLWQRGIALYYAGRYDACRRQFERHRTVNPDDVENAAWHFLCVARAESPRAARAQLLPVGRDERRPMREVYGLFQGRNSEQDVMTAAGADPTAQFFASLYVGLYLEATGEPMRSRELVAAAASDRFAAAGGYMHDVARVHLALRR